MYRILAALVPIVRFPLCQCVASRDLIYSLWEGLCPITFKSFREDMW